MINVTALSHSLGGREVLHDITLTVPSGSIIGLVGVNGAGKSTLLRLLAGVYLPQGGTISYDGKSPTDPAAREEIFFLPEDPYYTATATMRTCLAMYRPFYRVDDGLYRRLCDSFGLEDDKPLRTFSKGMRRQAFMALALAVRPRYLLLDEAFDGLDPLARKRVKAELIRLVEENDTCVILSSHSLQALEDLCDSFVLLDGRTVAAAGSIGEETDRYCKFMLAFREGIPEGLLDGLAPLSVERSDRFVRALFEGAAGEVEAALAAYAPTVLERLPVDFEEVFLCRVEGGNQA